MSIKILTAIFILVVIGFIVGLIYMHVKPSEADTKLDDVSPSPSIEVSPSPSKTPRPLPSPIPTPTPIPTPKPTPVNNVNEAASSTTIDPEAGEDVVIELTKPLEEIKPSATPTPTPSVSEAPAEPKPSSSPKPSTKPVSNEPKDGDKRVVDGQEQEYNIYFGWVTKETGGGQDFVADPDGDGQLSGIQVGSMD